MLASTAYDLGVSATAGGHAEEWLAWALQLVDGHEGGPHRTLQVCQRANFGC